MYQNTFGCKALPGPATFYLWRPSWHRQPAESGLSTPEGYAINDVARPPGQAGSSVAVIFNKSLKCSRVAVPTSSTFEAICVRLTSARDQVVVLNVYRSGSEKPYAQFFDELTAVLESLVINACPVVVGGDFNFRWQLTRAVVALVMYCRRSIWCSMSAAPRITVVIHWTSL